MSLVVTIFLFCSFGTELKESVKILTFFNLFSSEICIAFQTQFVTLWAEYSQSYDVHAPCSFDISSHAKLVERTRKSCPWLVLYHGVGSSPLFGCADHVFPPPHLFAQEMTSILFITTNHVPEVNICLQHLTGCKSFYN